jgi:ribosomal small subunit protein bTHX
MGKGDKKTRRGKIIKGSYGVLRPKKKALPKLVSKPKKETPVKVVAEAVEKAVKKPAAKKTSTKKASTKKAEAVK